MRSRMRRSSVRQGSRVAICMLAVLAPKRMRPRILNLVPGFSVDPSSTIGRSFLCPTTSLVIGPHAYVGHLTFASKLDRVEMGPYSRLGNFNSITGWTRSAEDPYAATAPHRGSELVLEERAAITNRHYLDCTASVRLAAGSVVGGLRTVIVSHGLRLATGDLHCDPVYIGRCSLVNTTCVIVGGSVLPDYCVLAPMSLLRERHTQKYALYAGNPASIVRELGSDFGVFRRLAADGSWSPEDPQLLVDDSPT